VGTFGDVSKRHPTPENQESRTHWVSAQFIARKYIVSSRHILLMAAAGKIPSIRVGRKCVRFDESSVAAAIEG